MKEHNTPSPALTISPEMVNASISLFTQASLEQATNRIKTLASAKSSNGWQGFCSVIFAGLLPRITANIITANTTLTSLIYATNLANQKAKENGNECAQR